ncbi:cytoplasmic 60S subunit biogenesis factor ZNF622 isoform X2 [Rhineura floridana]|nr:cytoplasmic 60S subunit biogenesis factor ZNF622 isoform X2 [Rhineura floridana]XP_061445594.1 cytoplasmic 60S subunit biogenesis factor ZNF622 isoform X2 [Rhineura floridana]XP_061445604.1 cytoplasmic 60S subunit biogenesis factor ZNF622 isoform X2 [Rhineura floridana]XP_061445621.1 cytoplasmic 60S subunit biogenesis factor ZNF622 isoform X2 [Rhineura floridana]
MASYTCISCHVAFKDADVQRAHYKTDWHRYNLKRKVAEMPPVTAENFQERVLAQRAVLEEPSKATATYCTACSKRFSNFNAYENHLKSKKHMELEKKAVQAVSKKVELLNEKNLEKGFAEENVDKDAMNAAIQQAIKAQPSSSPKKVSLLPSDVTSSAVAAESSSLLRSRERTEKPPRLQWFEQQAKKLAKEHSEDKEDEEDVEEGWEDVDSDEDLDSEEQVEGNPDEAEESATGNDHLAAGAIPVTDCLFCSHHSSSLMKNLAHMTKVHSFFIPDIEYLVDIRGLIKYLGEKVGFGKICLWCNEKGKSFYATEAVQAHMNDKSHCKLFTEGDAALEFADFYDFRSTYSDYQEGGDVEMSEELPSEKDLEYDDESMELILPSGARIGHRSLMRYYKQRFGSSRAMAVSKNKQAVGKVLQQYKALGWTSSTGAALACERDMQYLQRMKAKWMLKTSMQNNATKQMHFRMQVRF